MIFQMQWRTNGGADMGSKDVLPNKKPEITSFKDIFISRFEKQKAL